MIIPRQCAVAKTAPVSLSETARRPAKSVDPYRSGDVQPRRDRGTRQASGDLEGPSYAHHMDRPRGARRRRPVVLLRLGEGAGQEDELAHRRRRSAAHVVAAQRDAAQQDDGQGHEAAVDGPDRQPAASDAQPLRAADHRRRGHSDNIYGIDVEKGTQLWKRHFDSTFQETPGGRGYGPLCPGGLTATPVVAPLDTPGKYKVYAIAWDGRLRQLDAATGEDLAPAEPFLPSNGKPYALNLVNNVLYTTTAQGCGGNPNQDPRLARTAPSTPAAATATTTLNSRSTVRPSSA